MNQLLFPGAAKSNSMVFVSWHDMDAIPDVEFIMSSIGSVEGTAIDDIELNTDGSIDFIGAVVDAAFIDEAIVGVDMEDVPSICISDMDSISFNCLLDMAARL